MTQEEAKKRAEVMISYAKGCKIQFYDPMNKQWEDIDGEVVFDTSVSYRVKPEPKYRPFKTKEECWEEIGCHYPLGWLKNKKDGSYKAITYVYDDVLSESDFETYTFVDGTPFGVKDDNND